MTKLEEEILEGYAIPDVLRLPIGLPEAMRGKYREIILNGEASPDMSIEYLEGEAAKLLCNHLISTLGGADSSFEVVGQNSRAWTVKVANSAGTMIGEVHYAYETFIQENLHPSIYGDTEDVTRAALANYEQSSTGVSESINVLCRFPVNRVVVIKDMSAHDSMFGGEKPLGRQLKSAVESRINNTKQRLADKREAAMAESIRRDLAGLTGGEIFAHGRSYDIKRNLEIQIDEILAKELVHAKPRIIKKTNRADWQVDFVITDPQTGQEIVVTVEAKSEFLMNIDVRNVNLAHLRTDINTAKNCIDDGGGRQPNRRIAHGTSLQVSARIGERVMSLREGEALYSQWAMELIDPNMPKDSFSDTSKKKQYLSTVANEEIRKDHQQKMEALAVKVSEAWNRRGFKLDGIKIPSLSPTELATLEASKMELVYLPECDLSRLPGVSDNNLQAFQSAVARIYPFLVNWPVVVKGLFNGLNRNGNEFKIFVNGEVHERDQSVGGWFAVEKSSLKKDLADQGMSTIAPAGRTECPINSMTVKADWVRQAMRLAEYEATNQIPGNLGSFQFENIIEAIYRQWLFQSADYEMVGSTSKREQWGSTYNDPIILIPNSQRSNHARDRFGGIGGGEIHCDNGIGDLNETLNLSGISRHFIPTYPGEISYHITYRPGNEKGLKDFMKFR